MISRYLGESIGINAKCGKQKSLNFDVFDVFSLERMEEICCHSSVFLIRLTPTHDNSLGVEFKISMFWFAHPITG